jgi:signal recognition particle subunit SRP54
MGDIVGLVETAQKAFSQKQADELAERLRKKSFTLEDFRQQMLEVKKMGSLDSLASKLPAGMTRGLEGGFDENGMKHAEAILSSMTPLERERPHIIDGSRRKRIAKGSGTSVQEVNQMLRQFENVARMMKSVSKMGKFKADLLGRLDRF